MNDRNLTLSERALLEWLGDAPGGFAQYGECYGKDFDRLLALGLVQVHGPGKHQERFITKGDNLMFRAVSITPAAAALLARDEEP